MGYVGQMRAKTSINHLLMEGPSGWTILKESYHYMAALLSCVIIPCTSVTSSMKRKASYERRGQVKEERKEGRSF